MTIQFFGAAGTVTGSCYVLTSSSGQSIMIDCGMFQGTQILEAMNAVPIDFDVRTLSGFVLTHAHLDHCGRLPMIVKRGFHGPIFLTDPTRDITEISLFDTAKIAKFDKEKAILYDKHDVENTIALFRRATYDTPFEIGDFEITMRDAGHILGSASLEISDRSATEFPRTIVFSGDLGNTPQDLIQPTEMIHEGDVVVMESTYGDSSHPIEDPSEVIAREIAEIESTGGTLLIPAFSIERSQELLHRIMHLKKMKKIQNQTAIFFDSPMGEKVTQVFEQYREWCNSELQGDFQTGDPFSFPGLEVLDRREESEKAQEVRVAKVIIAGSGMMTGGRIVNHAIRFLSETTTRVLIVGYQGEETLGRELLEGKKDVVIEGTPVHVNATISHTKSMSSHADQPRLLNWLKNIRGVQKVILTHGEEQPRKVLATKISDILKITDISLPEMQELITL